MMSYNTYPPLPSAPADAPPQVAYHFNVVQANRRGLRGLNQLVWLNACSSGIRVATGISSVATFVTFIHLPISIPLGAASMTGAIAIGIISVLTKKYQQKLKKVMHLTDIVLQH